MLIPALNWIKNEIMQLSLYILSLTRKKELTIKRIRECPRGLMVKWMDYEIVISEFEILLRYYIQFWRNTFEKCINLFILPAVGSILPLLFY